MNILLIEPNYVLGQTYKRALQQAGHTIDWQKSAQAAITAADKQCPDVVVLELELAGHGGIEFLYEFRSYNDWQTIPIVLLTFLPEESLVLQRASFQKLGIFAHLYKPATNLTQFIRVVNDLPVPTP